MPRNLRLASTAIATALAAGIIAAAALATLPGRPASTTAKPIATHLVIRHVQKGCHVWGMDNVQTTSLRLNVAAGGRLHIVNRDIVAHQLVELAGSNLALTGHIMPGESQLITFSLPGLYRFKTKLVKMGPEPRVKTSGANNELRLTVSVP